jgi:uncharacterized metal-binding protein
MEIQKEKRWGIRKWLCPTYLHILGAHSYHMGLLYHFVNFGQLSIVSLGLAILRILGRVERNGLVSNSEKQFMNDRFLPITSNLQPK